MSNIRTRKKLPPSEVRRQYMKALIANLTVHGMGKEEARTAAYAVISLLQNKIKSGEGIDLGFLKIERKVINPRKIKCNIGGFQGQELFLGESTKWNVSVSKSWQEKVKPHWSRYK